MRKNIIKYASFALGGILLFSVIVFYPEKKENNNISESEVISLIESKTEMTLAETEENKKEDEYIKLKDENGNDIELENNKITILVNNETEEYILTEKDSGKTFDEIAENMGYLQVDKDDIETLQKGEDIVKNFVEQEINSDDFKVSNIQDNYTSSTSENIVPVVAEPEPQTEPETTQASTEPQVAELEQQYNSGYADTTIELNGVAFPVLNGFSDINNSKFGADTETDSRLYNAYVDLGKNIKNDLESKGQNVISENPIYVLNNKIIFDIGGSTNLELEKNTEFYKINLNINIFANENILNTKNKEVLKAFCYTITNNGVELYNCIENDYNNEIYIINEWNDTNYNFKIKVEEDKENHMVSYSVKSK